MRTQFEPDETEAFEATKDLLVRRCLGWAHQRQLTADESVLQVALDFRSEGGDGRLAFWTTELVRNLLLAWMPRKVSVSAAESSDAPESLRTLLRYLDHTELAEASGESLTDLEDAITVASAEFPQAMNDTRNFGLSKFWMMTALESGVDVTDQEATDRFTEQVRGGEVDYDDAALEQIMTRHLLGDETLAPRGPSMPPVSLPSEDKLAEAAENSTLVKQLRLLVDWLGRDGRALTDTGQLKLADARELVTLLDTGDTIDPVVGGRTFRTQSSAELTGLELIVAWAKKVRVVRVVKNRLVPIAKARPLLRDATALWNSAFDVIEELLEQIVGGHAYGHVPTLSEPLFREIVPDTLRTLYGAPESFPVLRLQSGVWLTCQWAFHLDDLDESEQQLLRKSVNTGVWRLLHTLADLGAVEMTIGVADPIYSADLDPDLAAESGFPPEIRDELRTALSAESTPADLVQLTDLATARVRTWVLDEGRSAPLVGELVDATPAQLLGAVLEQHSPETGREEIARWLSAHDSDGLQQLTEAVRRCPFRSRAVTMLDVLATTSPEGATLLHRLRSDSVLGPVAVQCLLADDLIGQDDLTEPETVLELAEHLIQALEVAGPETLQQSLLAEHSAQRSLVTLSTAMRSGHPDSTGLEELHHLVAEPLRERA